MTLSISWKNYKKLSSSVSDFQAKFWVLIERVWPTEGGALPHMQYVQEEEEAHLRRAS